MLILVLIFTLLSFSLCLEQPTDFDYIKHGDDWQCPTNGSKQSPIILQTGSTTVLKDSYIFGEYSQNLGTANFLNTTIYINTSDYFGTVNTRLIDGTALPLKAAQIKVRMHSEHRVTDQNGTFDMELQIFHNQFYPTNRNIRMAIGIFFNVGESQNNFVTKVIQAYESDNKTAQVKVDLSEMIGRVFTQDFWFYVGSNTIPPCSNGKINWYISKKVLSFTQKQKDRLLQILKQGRQDWPGNYRNIQARNGNVLAYRTLESEIQGTDF